MPEHAVLKLAVDNENLGLCDSRDFFTDKLNFDFKGAAGKELRTIY